MKLRGDALSILVVDDEAPARQRLIELIRQNSSSNVILEATDGVRAVETIRHEKPNIVFLDVQMPELNGVGVIAQVGASNMPLTVFVTAFDQHAIHAFEANALDYLLKPYSDERFECALTRAKERLAEVQMGELGERMLQAFAERMPGKRYFDRLVVKSEGTTRFVKIGEIESIEGAGNYVTLHIGGRELLYRSTLSDLSDALDPLRFVRIHRSAIVNIDYIKQLEPISHGEFELLLKSGRPVRVSRGYRFNLEKRLNQSL